MAKFETLLVEGFEPALAGMRNPLQSWNKSDSKFTDANYYIGSNYNYIGPNDYKLAKSLCLAGDEHRKWMRMIIVWVDISAPRFWWSEFDTYKVGTTANSESTMHTILKHPLTRENFELPLYLKNEWDVDNAFENWLFALNALIERANSCSTETENDKNWKEYYFQTLKALLPESFIQKRTVCLNYEVLHNMYRQRKNHRLPQWKDDFCSWIKTLPYSEFITEEFDSEL